MYNVPSFTLARAIGGVFAWYWVQVMKRSNTPLIILASVSLFFAGTKKRDISNTVGLTMDSTGFHTWRGLLKHR